MKGLIFILFTIFPKDKHGALYHLMTFSAFNIDTLQVNILNG